MKKELIDFLSGFPDLSSEEVEAIAEHIPIDFHPGGTILQEEGKIPQYCYYVLKGIVRHYEIVDGVENTIEFYSENNGTISSSYYVNQTPFKGYLVCSEDSILISGNPQQDETNYEKFPVLKSIVSRMVERELHDTREKFATFVSSSPKERYLNLMQTRPELIHRVPLHQIASYLGMTPESLSRIRKRIMEAEKSA